MRISQRLNLGFLAIAMWAAVVGHISLFQLNQISDPLSRDIPGTLESINEMVYMKDLAQAIRYYDEVSTQSARNYAFTQDKKWEQRYKDAKSEFDSVVKEAIDKGAERDGGLLSSASKAHPALAEMDFNCTEGRVRFFRPPGIGHGFLFVLKPEIGNFRTGMFFRYAWIPCGFPSGCRRGTSTCLERGFR